MVPKLQVLIGPHAGQEFRLDKPEILIGRKHTADFPVDIALEESSVSRKHARLRAEGDTYVLEDQQSKCGTFVNDRRISTRRLQDNDRIQLGGTSLLYRSAVRDRWPEDDDYCATVRGSLDLLSSSSSENLLKDNLEAKLRAVLHIVQALGGSLELDAVLSSTVDGLLEVFPHADRALILLQEKEQLVPKAGKDRHNPQGQIRYSRTMVSKAMQDRQAILCEDAAHHPPNLSTHSLMELHIRSAMCVPLLSRQTQPLGVVQVDSQRATGRFDAADMELLTAVAGPVSLAVENAQLHRRALRQAQLEKELQFARAVQTSILPRALPNLAEYRFWPHYRAAGMVGGDYYDFLQLPGGRQVVLLADVAGKGVPAALVMANAAALCKMALLAHPYSITDALSATNDEVCQIVLDGSFITLALCMIDPATHEMTMASAGHRSPLICRSDLRIEEPVGDATRGHPLGIVAGYGYEATSTMLDPGDLVVLFSDGIEDAINLQQERYTFERLRAVLARHAACEPAGMGQALIDDVERHVGQCEQNDDITLVVFGRSK